MELQHSMIVMDCQLAEACCLTQKLCFLCWIVNFSDTLSSRSLATPLGDIESVCLIRECHELEECLNVNLTQSLLTSETDLDMPSVTQIKKQTTNNSLSLLLGKCSQEDTKIIADIARLVSWSKLWDLAHNEGPKCVNALRAL